MADVMAKLAVGLLMKLVTETFLARLVIYSLKTWSDTTANQLDDKVVAAMAEALGVPVEKLKDGPTT